MDLKWQISKTKNINIACTLVHPAEVDAKVSTSKLPLRKVLDEQDSEELLDPFASGLNIEYQVDGKDDKFLNSKDSCPNCHSYRDSCLGVKSDRVHKSKYAWPGTGIKEVRDNLQTLCITVHPSDAGTKLSTSKS